MRSCGPNHLRTAETTSPVPLYGQTHNLRTLFFLVYSRDPILVAVKPYRAFKSTLHLCKCVCFFGQFHFLFGNHNSSQMPHTCNGASLKCSSLNRKLVERFQKRIIHVPVYKCVCVCFCANGKRLSCVSHWDEQEAVAVVLSLSGSWCCLWCQRFW